MATSEVKDAPPSSPIPAPPSFPVEWANRDDVQLFWMHERMHFPEPVSPLTESVWALSLKGSRWRRW